MSIKSKLALVAALATLIAGPAFAIDQQASDEARDRAPIQAGVPSGAYASAQPSPRAERFVQPTLQTQDFQSVGSR